MTKKENKEFTNEPKVKITEEVQTEKYLVFDLVTRNGEVYICITNYILSQSKFKNVEEAKAYIDSKPWELIINASCCLMELSNKQSK